MLLRRENCWFQHLLVWSIDWLQQSPTVFHTHIQFQRWRFPPGWRPARGWPLPVGSTGHPTGQSSSSRGDPGCGWQTPMAAGRSLPWFPHADEPPRRRQRETSRSQSENRGRTRRLLQSQEEIQFKRPHSLRSYRLKWIFAEFKKVVNLNFRMIPWLSLLLKHFLPKFHLS